MRSNPYNYNLPVKPKMFFGRDHYVDTLIHQLTAGEGDSILLIGGRRMGKTSLLEALKRVLQAGIKKPVRGLISLPIYLDLMGAEINSLEAFFRTMCERTRSTVEDLLPEPLNNTCVFKETESPLQTFQNSLGVWAQAIKSGHSCQLRLIWLLDECEEVFGQAWSSNLQGALRYLLNGQKTRDLLKVVIAGSHGLLAQSKQHGSPLWNVLTPHRLQALSKQATYELITKPTKGCLSNETVEAIVTQSGGHAFLTQYIMFYLWDRGLETATPGVVQQISTTFPKMRSDFRDWVTCLGDTGLAVFNVLVRTNSSISENTIQKSSHIAALDVADALDALRYHGLIVKEVNEDNYYIAGQMFRNWFITYMEQNKRT